MTLPTKAQLIARNVTKGAFRAALGQLVDSVTQVFTAADASQGLVDYIHVDMDTAHRDLIRAGWLPAFFNQQWGGAPHYFELVDASTGVSYKFEAATGYIEDSGQTAGFGDAAGSTRRSQGFKVSKSTTLVAIWLKVYKLGNPTDNLEVRILPDDGTGTKPTGSTPITNGTATGVGGKSLTSDVLGQWVRFVFPSLPAVTAGTQYHIDMKRSGALDGSNYYIPKGAATGRYPHGNLASGDGTPTWTATAAIDLDFLVEIAAADESLVAGGVFGEGKLAFFEGTPLNQSNSRVKDLRDISGLDLTDFTLAIFGNSWVKDKTILDITYGLDHDRIVLRSNVATGFAQVDLYDSSGTKKTVTGSTDISSGDSLLAIRIRAKGDGSDKVELWENGAKNANSLSLQTISFDKLFGQGRIGTIWLGGGWIVAPTWTGTLDMSALPSTAGWTYGGIATEANAFSVSGSRLYQNKNGYTALQDGYYRKTAAGLTNAAGWSFVGKVRIPSNTNTKDASNVVLNAEDGTKQMGVGLQEYYAQTFNGAANYYPQLDLKTAESVVNFVGKGSDAMTFINGRFVIDSTGQMTSASANNQLTFGDTNVTSGENADATWDYVKYYTALLAPQFTSGSISELAIWNGDRTPLLSYLWNGASPISVKQSGRLSQNTGPETIQTRLQQAITSGPTTASAVGVLAPEMESFVVGSRINGTFQGSALNGTSLAGVHTGVSVDGDTVGPDNARSLVVYAPAGNGGGGLTANVVSYTAFGLHKIEGRFATNGTGTAQMKQRERALKVEAKA